MSQPTAKTNLEDPKVFDVLVRHFGPERAQAIVDVSEEWVTNNEEPVCTCQRSAIWIEGARVPIVISREGCKRHGGPVKVPLVEQLGIAKALPPPDTEVSIQVGSDRNAGIVILKFNTPVAWVGMPVEQARNIVGHIAMHVQLLEPGDRDTAMARAEQMAARWLTSNGEGGEEICIVSAAELKAAVTAALIEMRVATINQVEAAVEAEKPRIIRPFQP